MKAYCANCQRVQEVEKVKDKELKKAKIKCCECGYVIALINPPKQR